MRNIISALARALRGAVSLPFWLIDHGWDAFKTAWRPRAAETDYAAEQAQQVIAEPEYDEMGAVVAALRIVIVNAKRSAADALPMQLEGLDSRWSEWLSRMTAPEAQRALNAQTSRSGALDGHRNGDMPMLGIPRVKSAEEYENEEKEALAAAREEYPTEPAPEPEPEEEQTYGMRR